MENRALFLTTKVRPFRLSTKIIYVKENWGAFAKVAERLLELQLLFCAQKRKAGSEEPAIHGIIRYDE